MADLDMVTQITTGGGLTVVTALVHFLRQIRVSIDGMDKNFKDMNESFTALNSTMVEVVTDRKRDKEEIDRLRSDIKQLWERVNAKS